MTKAPNFDGEFPGAGEKIGPVWQRLWDHMEDGRWYVGPQLTQVFAQGVSASAVRHILLDAGFSGVLEVKKVKNPRARNAHNEYRRTDSGVVKIHV